MALSKTTIKFLDSLEDELFLAFLWNKWGITEPVWEECSQEEYEKYNPKAGKSSLTKEDFEQIVENVWLDRIYKAQPIYKNAREGILFQLEYHKPDGFKYFKKVGEKKLIALGGDMIDYCMTRDCMKQCFAAGEIDMKRFSKSKSI